MYGKTAGAAGAAAMLPVTGVEVSWTLLAGVTLIAAGAALWRIIPRRQE
jgi:LPXTG-motif cell wall-anchored protein